MAEVPVNSGRVITFVDDGDVELASQHSWSLQVSPSGTQYARCHAFHGQERRCGVYLHALLAGPYMDHADGDGLNNRRSNLRPATRVQNGGNRKPNRLGSSQFKGVCRFRGGWRALIQQGSSKRHLGVFMSEEEAARAYDAAAIQVFGEFARLNFPLLVEGGDASALFRAFSPNTGQ